MQQGPAPYLGQDFFPAVDGGQIKLHVRAQTGTRIEDTTRHCDRVGQAIHRIIPANQLSGIVDNIGLSVSGINMAYNNSGTIGVEDADIMITLKPVHAPTANYVKTMRDQLPRLLPGTTFSFLPADMVTQILNFGAPAPIDLQVAGNDLAADRTYANAVLSRINHIPGIADACIEQAFQQPTLNVQVDRALTSLVGLSEKDAANAMLTTLAGSLQTSPTYWLNPKTGVSYPVSVQTPQRDIHAMSGLMNLPVTSGSGVNNGTQLLGGLATIQRTGSDAVASHYNVRPVIDIYATTQGRDLGAVAADIRKVMQDTAKNAPNGATVVLRGQVTTMTSAYQQLFVGLALAIVLIYLLIVVNFQSWLDPFIIVLLCSPFKAAGTEIPRLSSKFFSVSATEQGRRHEHRNDG
jgi:multidrug efflux pump subunit AcrB